MQIRLASFCITNPKYTNIYKEKVLIILAGIPSLKYYGEQGEYHIMIIELLGPSLDDLQFYCKGKFSLKTVLIIADQIIQRLEYLHSRYFVHRDLKPENFSLGLDSKANCIYLIDFGLAKRIINPSTLEHIPYKDNKQLTGTVRYCSINTHLGIEITRRDDMESLGYILIYFLFGTLPWRGTRKSEKQNNYEKITEIKLMTSTEELCKNIPKEFETYMKAVKDLKFDEKPDYFYLRKIFKDLFYKEGYHLNVIYDWALLKSSSKTQNKILQEENKEKPLIKIPGNEFINKGKETNTNEENKRINQPISAPCLIGPHLKSSKDQLFYFNFQDMEEIPDEGVVIKPIPLSAKYIKFKRIGNRKAFRLISKSYELMSINKL